MDRKLLLPFELEELHNYVVCLKYVSKYNSNVKYVFCDEVVEEYLKRIDKEISLPKARAINEVLFELFKEYLPKSTYDKFRGNSITFLIEMQPTEFDYQANEEHIRKFIEYYNNYDDLVKRIEKLEEKINQKLI